MLYNNLLVYIKGFTDRKTEQILINNINSYKYLPDEFIQKIISNREEFKGGKEVFCIFGTSDEINIINNEIKESINILSQNKEICIRKDIIGNIYNDREDEEKIMIEKIYQLLINIIPQKKLKNISIREIVICDDLSTLILYYTDKPSQEIDEEIYDIVRFYVDTETPYYKGKQIMIRSFLLEDIKDRKVLAVTTDSTGEWYALLEGGIKLYLSESNFYESRKVNSADYPIWTGLEIDSIIHNPMYVTGKKFEPYELFEEWSNIFCYALAILEVEYSIEVLKAMYKDFLTFMEDNICYGQEAPKLNIPEETFIMAFANTIKHIRNYLKGKEELAISKNLLILLKSRYVYLPNIYKIIGKYYPKEVAKRAEYNKFCNKKWESLLEAAQNGQSNYEKGVSLEDVADYYISCIEGLKVTERRVRTENEEIDLVCVNVSEKSELWKLGSVILVECKNWKNKVDPKVIRNLAYIMDKKGINSLFLFVKSNITSGVKDEIIKQAAHGKYVIVFTLDDLKLVNETSPKPVDSIIEKINELEQLIEDRVEVLM